jgi:hypothetical protein
MRLEIFKAKASHPSKAGNIAREATFEDNQM